jgi:hypothetical protein
VARVARPETVERWLARAEERTFKHLREEVEAVETIAKAGGLALLEPPDEELMAAWHDFERRALSGEVFVASQWEDGEEEAAIQMSGGPDEPARLEARLRPGAGKVAMRLNLREDLFRYWRSLAMAHARSGLEGPFVAFLCNAVWKVWLPVVEAVRGAWASVYERDRHRCTSPVCSRRDVTPHHLRFRSRGGGDEDANVSALCYRCHVDGVHVGRLRAEPPADHIRWLIGRVPLMEIDGRRRRLLL